MRLLALIISFGLSAGAAMAIDVAATLMADGFDLPVGKPNGDGYHLARGYRANGHLGEDWNGNRGGDTDLGDPVYTVANGLVVFARNFGHGWGNVVIVRHAYEESGSKKMVDSLYGHLDRILVREGQQLRRGQQLGTIGTGGGLYPAHLHLEMRKDIRMGMARHRFPEDGSVYWSPVDFIRAHHRMSPSTAIAAVPLNSFVTFDGPDAGRSDQTRGFGLPARTVISTARKVAGWKPDRFDDLRREGGIR
jgi:hypothetical protein